VARGVDLRPRLAGPLPRGADHPNGPPRRPGRGPARRPFGGPERGRGDGAGVARMEPGAAPGRPRPLPDHPPHAGRPRLPGPHHRPRRPGTGIGLRVPRPPRRQLRLRRPGPDDDRSGLAVDLVGGSLPRPDGRHPPSGHRADAAGPRHRRHRGPFAAGPRDGRGLWGRGPHLRRAHRGPALPRRPAPRGHGPAGGLAAGPRARPGGPGGRRPGPERPAHRRCDRRQRGAGAPDDPRRGGDTRPAPRGRSGRRHRRADLAARGGSGRRRRR